MRGGFTLRLWHHLDGRKEEGQEVKVFTPECPGGWHKHVTGGGSSDDGFHTLAKESDAYYPLPGGLIHSRIQVTSTKMSTLC